MEKETQPKEEKWSWLDHKPDNMVTIEGTPSKNFFKWWCIIMTPFIGLTPKEIDLVSSLLKQRHELSKKILDPILLDSQLMDNKTRDKVLKECNITLAHFYVLMSSLRSKGIITESGINSKVIPRISEDNNGFCQLLFLFKDDAIK
jgi:hypothetical protein